MADLIAKLKLDNSNWDNNINKARNSVKKFESDSKKSMVNVDNVTSTLGSSFMKFAGFIGLAVGAGETLNKMLRSNQTTSDLFDNNINAAKDSVNLFFKAISTGDFNVFHNGLIDTYLRLKDVSAAFDELADKKLSLSFISTKTKSELDRLEEIATNSNLSKTDRETAAKSMFEKADANAKKIEETSKFQIESILKRINAQSGMKFSPNELIDFIEKTNFDGAATASASTAYKKFIELTNKKDDLKADAIYDIKNYGSDPTRKYQKRYREALEIEASYKKQNEYLIKQGWLSEQNDEERKKIVESLREQVALEGEAYALRKRATGVIKQVVDGTIVKPNINLNKKGLTEDQKLESLQQFTNNSLENQVNNALAPKIQSVLDKHKFDFSIYLNLNEDEIEAEANQLTGSLQDLTTKINSANEAYQYATNDTQRKALKDRILKLNEEKNAISGIKNENELYGTSLQAIGSIMGFVGNMTDDSTASFIQYGVGLISTITSAIPAIVSLTTALTAKAAAEAAGSAAAIPVVGWIAAIGAVASIVAAMAAIPKFANGGIVGGSSYIGDNVLTRVNSGEMILNKKQQSNLFNLLSNNSKSIASEHSVNFKIQGKDLVGTLNNFNAKISKY